MKFKGMGLTLVLALLVSQGLVSCSAPPVTTAVHLPTGFDLEAHRGGRDARPENSLSAFAYALAVGVTTLEMDMQITSDGVIVVRHNRIIPWYEAKNSWGKFLVSDEQPDIETRTYDELKAYDLGGISPNAPFGYWDSHGVSQKQIQGTQITSLEEVFQLVRDWGNDSVFFNIETKSNPYPDHKQAVSPQAWVSKFYELVKKYGLTDRVMLQSFDWRTLVEMKKLDPSIPTVALTANQPSWNMEGDEGDYQWKGRAEPSPWMAGLDIDDFAGDIVKAADAIGADVISPYESEVTPSVVTEAHQLGMRVVPYTVNDPIRMKELILMQVDGIITDRPATLRAICQEMGIPVPAADPAPAKKPYFSGTEGL